MDRVATVLGRWSGRPILFAATVMNLMTWLVVLVAFGGPRFGSDSSL